MGCRGLETHVVMCRALRFVVQSRMASLMASLSVRLPCVHACHLWGAKEPHAEHVQCLALHVLGLPCKFRIVRPNIRGRRSPWRRRVWPAPVSAMIRGFFMRMVEEYLPDGVVDFVGPGMTEIFPL